MYPYRYLTYIDRLSMSHSVEPRSPFLDRELWDYVMSLPDKYRIQNGVTKYILKRLAERYLPKDIVYRQKEGFVFPLYPYLIYNQKLVLNRIQSLVSLRKYRLDELYNDDWLVKAFERLKVGKAAEYKIALVLHNLNIFWHWEQVRTNNSNR